MDGDFAKIVKGFEDINYFCKKDFILDILLVPECASHYSVKQLLTKLAT